LAPTWLGAHFPALDSAAPHRKLPRSRRRPALSGELRPARRGLHLRGCLTPPLLFPPPSRCRSMPRPSATTVRSSPPLQHSPATISTPGGCTAPWRCSRCAPHLRGRRVPRSQPARPASGPHARPVAKTARCTGGLLRPSLLMRAERRPTSRFFYFSIAFFKLFN
jgi:hypothetical protein